MTKTPVTFVTGVNLHFDCQSICCFIIFNHQAGVLLVRQGICDEAYGALFVRLVLFAGEERPYHRNNDQGYDEAYDYETAASFQVVHESVSARAEYQSVRRSTYRSCECARCCNSDSHQNCLRVSA